MEIAPEESTQPLAITADGLNRLLEGLTKAIGPLAPQIVREQISMLSESRYSFPESRINELLELIKRQLSDAEWTLFLIYYSSKRQSLLDKRQ